MLAWDLMEISGYIMNMKNVSDTQNAFLKWAIINHIQRNINELLNNALFLAQPSNKGTHQQIMSHL